MKLIEPFQYQKAGVVRIEDKFNGRALLADEMGLGKSAQALHYARRNWPKLKSKRPVVVVCPAGVKVGWSREAKSHVGIRTQIIEGTSVSRRRLAKHAPIIIINYDILQHWLPALKKLRPWLIVVDEGHYIKNPSAKRTRAVQALCKGVKKVLILTGSAITNRPAELHPMLHILKPKLFPSLFHFGMEFCEAKRNRWTGRWEYKGAKRLPKLHRILKREVMVRRLQEDVLDELPKHRKVIVPLAIERPKEYREAENNIIKWLRMHKKGKAARSKKAKTLIKLGVLKRLAAELKLKYVIEWIENFMADSDRKLVVMGIHKVILKALHAHFPNSVLVTGEVTGRHRQQAIDKFRRSKATRLCFGNLIAAGVGVNGLQNECSDIAHIEFSWVPTDHTQATARIRRIGQKKKRITSYYLLAENTIEEITCNVLNRKQQIVSRVLDGKRLRDSEFGMINEVTNMLKKKRKAS